MAVVLHRPASGPDAALADAVEAVLQEASAAYRTAPADGPPVVVDGQRRVEGDALLPWARDYAAEARRWRRATGDYCLMDDDGTIC